MSERHRADRIRQQLEMLKAEMARQDREMQELVADVGVDRADLEQARRTFADYLGPSEDVAVRNTSPLAFSAIRA